MRQDPETLRQWLYIGPEDLGQTERAELEAALAADPELAREAGELERLDRLIRQESLPVRNGFRQTVMSQLPAAGWEAQHPRSWRLAIGLFIGLAGAAAALFGMGSAHLGTGGAFLGALTAVADLFRSAVLAGAGLLAASWKGLGLTLGEATQGSKLTIVALGLLTVCLNVLFFMLRRGAKRPVPAAGLSRGERKDSDRS